MKKTIILFLSTLTLSASLAFAQDAADPALLEWRRKVTEARLIEDESQRADAMLALLREALSPLEVRFSSGEHTEAVHPDDNLPAPVVNFDPHLNQKTSARRRSGAPTRSLQNNFGYYFSVSGVGYLVLGPAALDPKSPVLTELAAEHELFHAMHHPGDPRPMADRELETWTEMFVQFFHRVHQFRRAWRPMLHYYEDATPAEREAAIERMARFYGKPPAPPDGSGTSDDVRVAFDEWLERRMKYDGGSTMIADLEEAIVWTQRVVAARALEDETGKREAMLALVREALPDYEVRASGTAHAGRAHPEDNQPAPIVNFDVDLNEKSAWSQNRRLDDDRGHYFVARGTPYVVLGPEALDPRSPVFTRMLADHELFHARVHVADPRPLTDRELQTWAHVFVTHFHEVHPFMQRWGPLVSYYEKADPGERVMALEKLVAYYREPSAVAEDAAEDEVRIAFQEWLERRRNDSRTAESKLVADLDGALAEDPAGSSGSVGESPE
ncbi:MAG: hypothetical protein ACRD2J_00445 [Thermoanaerobaculia bacterium]